MSVTTGIRGLDSLTGKGFPSNTVVLVSGQPGTGKTLLSLGFLMEGARKGEKCCFVSLSEKKDELVRACKGIDSMRDVEKHLGKNLAIEHIELGENITLKRFLEIMSKYPKLDRLVIDNVNKLLIFSESPRYYRLNLAELVKHIKVMGCSLLLCESNGDAIDSGNHEAFECDGVVQLSFLDFDERPMRSLSIHKMRYAEFQPRVHHRIDITSKGISLSRQRAV